VQGLEVGVDNIMPLLFMFYCDGCNGFSVLLKRVLSASKVNAFSFHAVIKTRPLRFTISKYIVQLGIAFNFITL
jgi:hypothetical protein